MKKRGQLVLKYLFVIIACAMIIVGFLQAGKSFGSQDAYFKLAVAKDIALMLDTSTSIQGDLKINYDKDLSKYTIEIKDSIVKVYRSSLGATDITASEYRFFGSGVPDTRLKSPKKLVIAKTNDKITLQSEQVFGGFGGSGQFQGAGASGKK